MFLQVQRYNFFSDILAEQSFPRISEEKRLFFKKIATQNTSTEQYLWHISALKAEHRAVCNEIEKHECFNR